MKSKKSEHELVFEIALFVLGIALIANFYKNNILLTILLILVWIGITKFFPKKNDKYFFATAAILGPIGEIVCIKFGAWQYANPTFLNIPIWLPLVWGLLVTLIKRTVETFVSLKGY